MAKNAMSATFYFIDTASFSLTCEIKVDTYEVLVEANLPTRWVYSPQAPPEPPQVTLA